ncbi:MAG: hypothetical protein ACRDL5_16140, partial [Solirubrobacteraceae bacterium]
EMARSRHIPVYTIALRTSEGTIQIRRHGATVTAPVPVAPQALARIARLSGGRTFTAGDSATASAIYRHLATLLGHKHVKRELTASFAGAGLALLAIGGGLSLAWFGRLV